MIMIFISLNSQFRVVFHAVSLVTLHLVAYLFSYHEKAIKSAAASSLKELPTIRLQL